MMVRIGEKLVKYQAFLEIERVKRRACLDFNYSAYVISFLPYIFLCISVIL